MLNNMSISRRIALGVFVPLIGLSLLGSLATWEAYVNYKSTRFLGYVSETINELAALNDVLQIERGQTAIFIGSGSSTPQTALVNARKNTDVETEKLHEVLEHIKTTDNKDLVAELAQLEGEIYELDGYRVKIDAGNLGLAGAMEQYTKKIAHIIEIGFHASKKAKDAELALETVALLDLTEAKEYAGQERGLVAGLVAGGKLTSDKLIKLEKLIGKQETLLENFLHNQPLRSQKAFKAELAKIDSTEVDKYRKQIVAAATGGEALNLDAKKWFDIASARISQLRELEIHAGEIITEESAHTTSAYFRETMIVGAISLIILLGAVILGFLVARSISKAVRETSDQMRHLANGDLDVHVTFAGANNELGEMADAIQVFKDNAIARKRMEEEAEEERQTAEANRAANEQARDKHQQEVETVVQSLGNALKRLADGDLTKRISSEYAQEFVGLKNDFENSVTKLSSALNAINETTLSISDDSEELKSAADDLAKRTEQQAAALEETSAALEEITSTVKESADRAQEASSKAAIAKQSTAKSGSVVNDAVDAMERIESASNEIAQIIGVIDDIAFQTNLLALNAGVEAARAGEAGKGFAVVAQEVRELAQRSADAAKEIKELITNSGQEVENGVSLVKATGEALTTISDEVNEIDTHIQSIAKATAEQSQGLTEINRAVNEMDQVTQHNAAMVEETNAVSHRLTDETAALKGLITQFQTNGMQTTSNRAKPTMASKPSAPVAAQEHKPVPSPQHAMVNKVAANMGGAAAAQQDGDWDEF